MCLKPRGEGEPGDKVIPIAYTQIHSPIITLTMHLLPEGVITYMYAQQCMYHAYSLYSVLLVKVHYHLS